MQPKLSASRELCIADDASGSPAVRQILDEYRLREPRIQVTYRSTTNGHISRASNTALRWRRRPMCCCSTTTTNCRTRAAAHCPRAREAPRQPDPRTVTRTRSTPPGDASTPTSRATGTRDLLYAQNYVSHLGVWSAQPAAGDRRLSLRRRGQPDHDLLLRCLPHVRPAQIVHVLHVLYHQGGPSWAQRRSPR